MAVSDMLNVLLPKVSIGNVCYLPHFIQTPESSMDACLGYSFAPVDSGCKMPELYSPVSGFVEFIFDRGLFEVQIRCSDGSLHCFGSVQTLDKSINVGAPVKAGQHLGCAYSIVRYQINNAAGRSVTLARYWRYREPIIAPRSDYDRHDWR